MSKQTTKYRATVRTDNYQHAVKKLLAAIAAAGVDVVSYRVVSVEPELSVWKMDGSSVVVEHRFDFEAIVSADDGAGDAHG